MENEILLTQANIEDFCRELSRQERSPGTVAQYRRSLTYLSRFLSSPKLAKESLLLWKEEISRSKAVRTANCMIAAVNGYLEYAGAAHLKLKSLRSQRKVFSEEELTQEEFCALVRQAEKVGDTQTSMLLRAMSETGVRVSEVRFLTVEAVRARMAVIRLKGKTRQIPLGDKLCRGLLEFARKNQIASGPLFVSRRGCPLDRRRIWERMKRLCVGAKIDPKKVHPHALRHLFARLFYGLTQDIAKLADLLGHGSIETTRIYIMTSVQEHRCVLDRLSSRLNAKKPPVSGGKTFCRT